MEQKHQSQGVFNGIVKSQQGAAAGQGCGEWQAHVGGQAGGTPQGVPQGLQITAKPGETGPKWRWWDFQLTNQQGFV